MKTKILFLGLVLSLLTISCSKDKNDDGTITADEISTNAKLDAANDDVSNVVEDQFDATVSDPSGRSMSSVSALLPVCAQVTRVPAIGTPLTAGTTVTKTINFGSGCTMPNGNVLSGSIVMTYVYQPGVTPQTINVSYNNFHHNNFLIGGTKTLTRTMTTATATSPSHPIVSININLTATNTLNGNVHTRTGTRVREFVEGFYTPLNIWDNVFKITGNWTTTHPNGNSQTSTISTPVMVKFSCANTIAVPRPSIMAEGIITTVRNSHTATLDFGNGACDNTAIFTLDGVAHTITIN